MASSHITAPSPITCRIRRHPGELGRRSPLAGQIELENNSSDPIDIVYERHVLQFLNFNNTALDGHELPTTYYGDIVGSVGHNPTLRLMPGETFVHNVALLGNLAEVDRRPGRYTVVAVYEYNNALYISEPYTVEVP